MRFDSPVGTQAERDGAQLWPGKWVDATGFATYYTATGSAAYHPGADLNLNAPAFDSDAHAPVYAVADGLCVFAGLLSSWGTVVVIHHGDVWARYAHVESLRVKAGDAITRGQQIAQIGNAAGRYPYHLHFDLARIDLGAKPGDWPGLDKARLLRDYVDPLVFLEEHHADPKGAEPMKATVNNPVPASGGLTYVFDGPSTAFEFIGMLPKGFQGEFTPQPDGWAHVVPGPMLAGQPLLDKNGSVVTGHVNQKNLIFENPNPSFTINPPTIPAGGTITLSWQISDVTGVWLVKPDGVAYPTEGTAPDGGPHVETAKLLQPGSYTYTLRVLYRSTQSVDYPKTITVTPAPVPEPQPVPAARVVLGVNNVKDGKAGQRAIDAGAPSISVTFNPDFAAEVRRARPSLAVAARGLASVSGYTPSVDQWWGTVWQAAVDGVYLLGLNENDHGIGTSPDDIRRRIDWDRQALARVKAEAAAKGITLYYCGGGFSAGCPDITSGDVVKAMAGYYDLMMDPRFRFNQHLYATGDNTAGQTPEMIRDLIFSDAYGDIPLWRVNATGGVSPHTQRVQAYDWTVRRWIFYYTLCGWSPTGAGRIVSDECGLDIGGVGGFAGVAGCDDAFMQRWARRFIQVQSQPIILNGVQYTAPVEWCNLFQTGDPTWGSYEIAGKLPALQACQWGRA